MKKLYLSLVLGCLVSSGFATTWYSQADGDAANLGNWNSISGGGGSTPVSFATPGDVWIMQNNLFTFSSLPSFSIGGTLTLNSANFTDSSGTLSIGGDLNLTGTSVLNAGNLEVIYLSGNLSVLDNARILNSPSWSTIHFANTLLSLATPQTITWTSTGVSDWAQIAIDANCFVRLLSNVTLPINPNGPDVINGTLICDNYVLNCNEGVYAVQLTNGASLYTANVGGIDASVICAGGHSFSSSANYYFNGIANQVTGSLLPISLNFRGSVTINNPAGVSLTQSTSFYNGSSLNLMSGTLAIGDNNVFISSSSSLTGTFSSSAMVATNGIGQLQKEVNEDGSYMFPVGDVPGNYTPITLSFTGSGYDESGAFMGVTVTPLKHPNNANQTNFLNRYWSVYSGGISDLSYSVMAQYAPGDVSGMESAISGGMYAGSLPWTKFSSVDSVAHSFTTTLVNTVPADFSGISTAPPAITLTPDASICWGNSIDLAVLSATTDTPFTFTWSPATFLSATTGTSVTASPTSNITYTVTVTDGNGFMATATTTVTVNSLPNVYEMTGGGSYCDHSGGVHVGLGGSDGGIRYQLYANDTTLVGSPAPGTGSSIDFGLDTLAGNYTAVATDTLTGCTSDMAGYVTVIIIPTVTPSVNITPSIVDTVCEGTLVTFTAGPTNGGDEPYYQWQVNGTVMGGSGDMFSYVPVNGDVVRVRLTSSAVCPLPDTAVATRTMSVMHPVLPGVLLTVSPNDTVCAGTEVTLNAHPTYGGDDPGYLWILNTMPVGTGSSYTYTPADGDNFYCIMSSNYFCRTTTDAYSNVIAMSVEAPAASIPVVNMVATPGTTIGRNQPDTIIAMVTNGGVSHSYQWYRNGSAIPGATTAIYTRTSFNNNDSISCIVTRNDACGMSSFNSVIITVTTVGVDQVTAGIGDLKLIPNPNQGDFAVTGTLASGTDEAVNIEITNVVGQVVYSTSSVAIQGNIHEQIRLNNSLPAGTYLLSLRSAAGSSTMRFIINR